MKNAAAWKTFAAHRVKKLKEQDEAMDNEKAIVYLTKENIFLREQLETLQAKLNKQTEHAVKLDNYLARIAKVLNYTGHEGNMAGMISEILAKQ